ncbi:MAG: FKBP-type peptidyl-prolyl cis-trans isomerase [Bacteroidales bacterium]
MNNVFFCLLKSGFYSSFIVVFLLLFSACDKDDPEYQAEKDREIILEFIKDNNLDAHEVDDTGVFYVIDTEGVGGYPSSESFVQIKNMGFYLDKDDKVIVFQPLSTGDFYLKNTILGWQYGVPKFNRGAAGMLLIPSALGYGPYPGYSGLPPNQVLFFEIEMIDFD